MCSCSYCSNKEKPTVRIKAASTIRRERKLSELASIIKGVSYPAISYVGEKTNTSIKTKAKAASYTGNLPIKLVPLERQFKLRELGRLIRGL
jgi:hypothetical protein